jgi:hypothetical protein
MSEDDPYALTMESPQCSSPSVSDLPVVVRIRTPQAQRSAIQDALTSSHSLLDASFRVGIYLHHFRVPKGCLICVFSARERERNSTYVGVVDQQLQNRIDDLQVYLWEFPSVTLGRGVYRVADILAVILLLCERQHGSLSYTPYNRLRLELKEELEKELVVYQGILSSEPEASYVLRGIPLFHRSSISMDEVLPQTSKWTGFRSYIDDPLPDVGRFSVSVFGERSRRFICDVEMQRANQ